MEQTDDETSTEQKVAERIQRQVVPVVEEESDFVDEYELERKKRLDKWEGNDSSVVLPLPK